MTADKKRVLIIGAGVAGLATYSALSQLPQLNVRLIERSARTRCQSGMNLAVPPNGARALRDLGIDVEHVLLDGHILSRYELRGRNGRLISAASLKPIWIDHQTPYFSIRRERLLEKLASACPADIEYETTASELKIGDSCARLSLSTPSREEEQSFDLVIAADGVHSPTRNALRPDLGATSVGQFSWRCTIAWPDPETLPHQQVVYSSGGRTFLLIPQGDDRVYVYAALVSDAQKEEQLVPQRGPLSRVDHLTLLFSGFRGLVPTTLQEIRKQCRDEDIYVSPLHEADSRGWLIDNHLLLIGDAAHGTSPSMAQGAALALEDAVVLRELLEDLEPGDSLADKLAGFEHRRRTRTHHVMVQSRARDAILKKKAASPVLSLLVDQAVRFKGMARLMEEGFRLLVDERP